ncbi:MAG: hypothetical protein NZ890_04500 [Myxococcota bacterium]|nr:hypothetical protein [Myxococcota bacterium]
MPSRRSQAAAQQLEIGTLYEQELRALNEDLRRQAALSMFSKLQPSNKISVEQFIESLRQHKEVWSVVSTMGIVDFADCINDGRRLRELARSRLAPAEPAHEGRRTRLSEQQKQALKVIIQRVLAEHREGLNRNEIAGQISLEQAAGLGIDRAEMANKLRQPLAELVSDGKIHTVGEKRLLKYLPGPDQRHKDKT